VASTLSPQQYPKWTDERAEEVLEYGIKEDELFSDTDK
jgi:hypothetical protein